MLLGFICDSYSYTTSLLNFGLIYAPFSVLPTAAGTCNWAYTKSHFKEISHSFDDRYGCHRSGKKFFKVRESHFIVRENLRLWKKSGKNEILKSTYLLFFLSWCVQVMEILESHEIFEEFHFPGHECHCSFYSIWSLYSLTCFIQLPLSNDQITM